MPPLEATNAVPQAPAPWRAWCNLVLLSMRRQARAHWLVWASLGMLALSAVIVHIVALNDGWSLANRREPRRVGPTFAQHLVNLELAGQLLWSPAAGAVHVAAVAPWFAVTHLTSGIAVFSGSVVFTLFATFLLPMWTLSFATEGLGREREAQTLIWTLVRPIPRPAIFLAKYLAVLPWCLAFNLGGLFLLCWLADQPGRLAFRLYWQAALWGTLAFAALFHLLGACLRRASIVALLYAFFLETLAGNMPGLFKRFSVSFYMRCLMFESGSDYGIGPDRPWIYQPVSGATAAWVLAGATILLLAAGMVVFSRSEYLDVK